MELELWQVQGGLSAGQHRPFGAEEAFLKPLPVGDVLQKCHVARILSAASSRKADEPQSRDDFPLSLNCNGPVARFGVQGAAIVIAAHRKEDTVLSTHTEATLVADKGAAVMAARQEPDSEALLAAILTSLNDDKAEDIVQIDLRGKSSIGDYMVVASGRSTRQVISIAEKLVERLKHEFGRTARVEGKDAGDWVLIDTGDVIVHVFRPEVRDFYQLEKMWLSAGPAEA